MAERSLRGTNLSALSMETDANVVLSERQLVRYVCPEQHISELPFSVEADVPPVWECRCGLEAKLVDGPEVGAQAGQGRPHPLGHAARAPLHPRARGAAGGAPEPAARLAWREAAPQAHRLSPSSTPDRRPRAGTPSQARGLRLLCPGHATACARRQPGARAGARPSDHLAADDPGAAQQLPLDHRLQPPAGHRPGERQQEDQPDQVGEEAGQEQQHAADQHQRRVGQLAAPASARCSAPCAAPPAPAGPRVDQLGAQQRLHQHQQDGRPHRRSAARPRSAG